MRIRALHGDKEREKGGRLWVQGSGVGLQEGLVRKRGHRRRPRFAIRVLCVCVRKRSGLSCVVAIGRRKRRRETKSLDEPGFGSQGGWWWVTSELWRAKVHLSYSSKVWVESRHSRVQRMQSVCRDGFHDQMVWPTAPKQAITAKELLFPSSPNCPLASASRGVDLDDPCRDAKRSKKKCGTKGATAVWGRRLGPTEVLFSLTR